MQKCINLLLLCPTAAFATSVIVIPIRVCKRHSKCNFKKGLPSTFPSHQRSVSIHTTPSLLCSTFRYIITVKEKSKSSCMHSLYRFVEKELRDRLKTFTRPTSNCTAVVRQPEGATYTYSLHPCGRAVLKTQTIRTNSTHTGQDSNSNYFTILTSLATQAQAQHK